MTHGDEIGFDEASVRALLVKEAPDWADLPVRRVSSSGTDNALFRLGEHLVLRLPRRQSAVALLAKELDWLPRLRGLPLDVPELQLRGRAGADRRYPFGIFRWLDGQMALPEAIADRRAAAVALAQFLKALQRLDTQGAPPAGEQNSRRGVALGALCPVTLKAIDRLADEIDAHEARARWQAACRAVHRDRPVWLHGDLKADNLLARNGRLGGVIDWGLSAVGDPAADYAVAWTWIDPSARDVFRAACAIGAHDWSRAEGWALYGAVIALSHYRGGRNEALCRQCRLTLSRLGLLRAAPARRPC